MSKTPIPKEKYCPGCKIIKHHSRFWKSSTRYDGLASWCKDCHKRYEQQQLNRNLNIDYKNYDKFCTKCKKTKKGTEFGVNKRKKDGLAFVCLECRQKQNKQSRETIDGFVTRIYGQTKKRAEKRKLEFNLTKEWFKEKIEAGYCEATGHSLSLKNPSKYYHNPEGPSIDRIDPNKGYTKDNCQIVCRFYNWAKSEYDQADFKKYITLIYNNL